MMLLSPSVLALKLEDIIRRKAKENQVTSTGGVHPQLCQNSDKATIDTKKELAKVARVSHDTIAPGAGQDAIRLRQELGWSNRAGLQPMNCRRHTSPVLSSNRRGCLKWERETRLSRL